ncbi:50S ribosomal protein L35, partial [Salmonella enterica subsp. enterica serovar Anatum]|nr:50S ribosomal protein L35 [Salmonella enterica subsp. enterica serovar Anatum]
KSTKRKRNLRATNHVKACDTKGVARMLPYL